MLFLYRQLDKCNLVKCLILGFVQVSRFLWQVMRVHNSLNTVCTYTGTQTHHFENRFRTNIYPYHISLQNVYIWIWTYTWRRISSELIHLNMNLYMTTYLFRTYIFEYELIHNDVSLQNLYIWIWTYPWRRISSELIQLHMNLNMTTYRFRTFTIEYELIHDDVSLQNLYNWIWTYTWRRNSLEVR